MKVRMLGVAVALSVCLTGGTVTADSTYYFMDHPAVQDGRRLGYIVTDEYTGTVTSGDGHLLSWTWTVTQNEAPYFRSKPRAGQTISSGACWWIQRPSKYRSA